jgi:hypothetical protein
VVATHGRGFWILDDITPLRHLARSRQAASLQRGGPDALLYPPQPAYRLRRNQNTDTPLPPEFPAGRNPPDGAIIDYYLRDAASGPVVVEIFTPTGRLARRFSSDAAPEPIDEKQVNVPLYWLRPPVTLPASKGMHRFVWDLHYPAPATVQHEYPISAIVGDTPREPLGVLALPGVYTVKLTVGGRTFTQPLTLKMDPRVKTPPLGLSQQFDLAAKLAALMNRCYTALESARRGRDPAVANQPSSLERDLTALTSDLVTAYAIVEGADAAPTTQAVNAVVKLQQRLARLLERQPGAGL